MESSAAKPEKRGFPVSYLSTRYPRRKGGTSWYRSEAPNKSALPSASAAPIRQYSLDGGLRAADGFAGLPDRQFVRYQRNDRAAHQTMNLDCEHTNTR